MARINIQAVLETSLLGRLVAFAFATWDQSLVGQALAMLRRLFGRIFLESAFGRVWYSNWPTPGQVEQSWTGRMIALLNAETAGVGRRLGPRLAGVWQGSLLVRASATALRAVQPVLSTSFLFQAFLGYSGDVQLAPTETGRQATSPLVWVLGALLGLLPLVPIDFMLMGLPVPSPTVLMIIGVWTVALVWVARKFVLGDYRWRASSAFLPLAVLLLVALAATVQSVSPADSALSLLMWVTAGLLFWLVVNLVRNSRDASALLGPILAGASLMTVWAVYQVFFPPVIEERWVDPTTSGEINRVFASMGNPNYLAEYMALYLPLGLALWFQQPRRRLELAIPVGLMALALVLTYSRGGWLAAVAALVLLVLMRVPRWSVLFFLGALLAPLVAPESILMRVVSAFTLEDTSNLYRVNLWTGVLDMLEKFWVLGAGLGATAFAKVYQEFMLPEARAAHAHNTYLQMFAETGILGLLAVLWTLLAVIRRTFTVGVNPRNAMLIAAVPAALAGMMFHGLVEHIWYNPKLLFAFWAVAGLGMGLTLGDREGAAA